MTSPLVNETIPEIWALFVYHGTTIIAFRYHHIRAMIDMQAKELRVMFPDAPIVIRRFVPEKLELNKEIV